jgi:hypothetical protein
VRFGVRLGPFCVSTSTRRRRRPTQAQIARAERERREAEANAQAQRVAQMSPEEYRREAEADPAYRDWLRRREAQTEAELQRLKGELADGEEPGA